MKSIVLAMAALTIACAQPRVHEVAQQPPPPSPRRKTVPVEVKVLRSYRKSGDEWNAIQVPKDITREQLIDVARNLFEAEPRTIYRFFTDSKEYERYVAWDQNYPNPAYPYPEKWVNKHYIAMINKMAGEGWVLWAMVPAGLKFSDDELIVRLE